MIGRMVLLSGFALVFLLALGLNRYLNRALIKPRVVRWLAQGLFVALIPALLAPAAVIAINPTVPYPARIELMLYVYLFYAGAGVALVCVVALSAVAGVIAIRRGDVRRFLKRSVAFVRRFADALKYGSRVWMDRRNSRGQFPVGGLGRGLGAGERSDPGILARSDRFYLAGEIHAQHADRYQLGAQGRGAEIPAAVSVSVSAAGVFYRRGMGRYPSICRNLTSCRTADESNR